MSDRLFRLKPDGEYVPVGFEFTGWPANGIWFVEDGKQSCIHQMTDVSEKPSPSLASYMKCREELETLLLDKNKQNDGLSISDVAEIACEYFAIKAGGIKTKDEIIEY